MKKPIALDHDKLRELANDPTLDRVGIAAGLGLTIWDLYYRMLLDPVAAQIYHEGRMAVQPLRFRKGKKEESNG